MAWALEPQDAVAIAVPYLANLMPGCTVGSRVEHRNRMVKVEAAGGTRREHVLDSVTLIVQTYAPTVAVASRDCRDAYTHLMSIRHDADAGRYVRAVDTIALPGRFDDDISDTPRFQTTVQISLRPLPMGATP